MEPPWEGIKKVYINGPGHMTFKNLLQNLSSYDHELGMEHYILKLYRVYINDDPELILTHFKTMSNLAKLYSRPRYQMSIYRTIGPLV